MKGKKNRRAKIKRIALLSTLVFCSCLLFSHAGFADFSLREEGFTPTGKRTHKYVPGEIIVKFKDVATKEQIRSVNSKYKTSVLYTSPYAGFKIVKIPQDKGVFEMIELYRKNPLVEYAEPNYIRHARWAPNDPYYSDQWHFSQINMSSAWDIEQGGGSSVIVAVLDSGVAYEDYGSYQQAPDLAGTNFVAGYDFVNDDSHPNDDNGHGTHVTGTIAQTTNNGIGVAGIAFNCSIMPVKILDAYGNGTVAQEADGIYYAVDHGAEVINLSIGGSSASKTEHDAIKYAYNKGVIVVAATGNDNLSSIEYPAAYDECIAVGAVRYDKTRAPYSNYGAGIELMAPGGDTSVDQNGDGYLDGILQQTFTNEGDPTSFSYRFLQGTSFAAPHVTGIVALMLSHGTRGVENIRTILHSTAEDLGSPGYDTEYGYGLVDAAAALSYTEYPDLTITDITSTPNPSLSGEQVQITVEFANQGAADAGSFYLDLYKNRDTAPSSGDLGDKFIKISGLAAGASSSHTFTCTYNSTGTKKIWAQIDTDGVVEESDETNNIYGPYYHNVTEPLPDLTITDITSSPNPSTSGDKIQVTVEFANQGASDAGSFWIDLYKDQDTAPESGDLGDKFVEITGLAAGATSSYTFTYAYNSSGTKKIWAQIDTNDNVNESNENNNIYGPYSHQVVSALPDLTITDIISSPNPSALYQDIQVTVEFENRGDTDAEWFWIDLYTDSDTAPESGEEGDRIHFVPGLPAGAASSYTFSYVFYLTEGEKKIWAQIDTDDYVSESNESNNIYGPYSHEVVDVYKLSFSTSSKKWRMFSVPVELYDPSPSSVLEDDLGGQNDTVWKVYRWDTEAGSYTKYPDIPDIKPGTAFWIITKDSKNIDVGGGECIDTSSDYVIPLSYSTASNQGWNQIGNPFLFPVRLDDVKVKKGLAVVSLQQAHEYGWVRDRIWWYTGSEYDHTKNILEPWEGYWVKALVEGCELLIPPVEAEESFLQAMTKAEENYLQITAKVGDLKDSYNFIGFSDAAKDTYDKEDVEEAPPVSPYISLSFPHPDWGKDSGSYTQDIRKTPDEKSYPEKIVWDMQVTTDQVEKTITLEWKNTQAIPDEYHLYLLDEQDKILANMRKVSFYSYTSLTEEEKFKIVATKENLLPEKLTLQDVGNYPNPVHSEFTTIRFKLGKEAKVTIKIYTISGELVRTLFQDRIFSSGLNDVVWDLKNDAGEKVARGIYILLVKARASKEILVKTGKIALIK